MNAAQLFVQCLEAEGVTHIFGVPGEENACVMLAIEDSSIEFILTRHEQGAAFMADVYGRLTGKAGVCLGTLGPGATNLVTGVADANMDRSPLVVITGQADSQRMHRESHQAMDVVHLFEPITKWTTPIVHPNNIPEVVRKAFKIAAREKPGACHIEIGEDIAAEPVESSPIHPVRVRRPVADEKAIALALDVICDATRPIVIAGNGAIRTRASKQLRRFAELTGIGVTSTFMGKGSISRDDPACLFTMGLQSRDVVKCAVDAADVVITVGYDMVEYEPRLWNDSANKRIVHIDFLPAEVDDYYRVAAEVVGDVAHALWMINERVTEKPLQLDGYSNAAVRDAMLTEFAAHKDDDTEGVIRPQKILWDAREALGGEDILLSDVGAHKMWIARYYQCEAPNTCLIPNGFCSMGFALPGAIAASLVYPERNILAICGDGGFLMNVQELETAVRVGAKPVVMVWEDGGYGLISWKQDTQFGRHTNLSFGNPDFTKLAEAFGWNGVRVNRSRDVRGALEDAFAAETPTLISVPIDYRENQLLTERLGDIVCPI